MKINDFTTLIFDIFEPTSERYENYKLSALLGEFRFIWKRFSNGY